MAQYRYKAVGQSGQRISGEIDAQSRDAVLDQIFELGYLPIDVVPVRDSGSSSRSIIGLMLRNRPSKARITIFTRELAMLLEAGLTLERSLAQLERNGAVSSLAQVLVKLRSSIDDGKPFHEALAACNGVFPEIYIALIRVAEATGTLAPVLKRIAEMREKEQKLRADILSAMLYPALLILTAIGAIGLIMMFVVPKFKQMLMGSNLPISDAVQGLMATSDWLAANGAIALFALLVLAIVSKFALRHAALGRAMEVVLNRLPLVGNLRRLHLGVNFCRTLGVLLENGVDLHSALSLTGQAVGIGQATAAIDEACEALRKGQSFTGPLSRSPHFHPLIGSMFKVGEETDNLSSSTRYLAQFFEDKLDLAIKRTFTIVEPIIIILVSIGIASIIITIMSAILSLNDLVI